MYSQDLAKQQILDNLRVAFYALHITPIFPIHSGTLGLTVACR